MRATYPFSQLFEVASQINDDVKLPARVPDDTLAFLDHVTDICNKPLHPLFVLLIHYHGKLYLEVLRAAMPTKVVGALDRIVSLEFKKRAAVDAQQFEHAAQLLHEADAARNCLLELSCSTVDITPEHFIKAFHTLGLDEDCWLGHPT